MLKAGKVIELAVGNFLQAIFDDTKHMVIWYRHMQWQLMLALIAHIFKNIRCFTHVQGKRNMWLNQVISISRISCFMSGPWEHAGIWTMKVNRTDDKTRYSTETGYPKRSRQPFYNRPTARTSAQVLRSFWFVPQDGTVNQQQMTCPNLIS